MTLPASDNFNRASSIPASGWGHDGYCYSEIYNNTVLRSSSSFGFMYWSADTPSDNHWSECKAVNDSNRNCGPAVRIGTTSRNGYYYSISGKVLAKYVNNSSTVLQTISSDTPNSTSVYRLEVNGSTLKVYKDGVQIGTDTTDTSHTTGRVGVFIGSAAGPQVDDWAGDNMPSTYVTADNSTQANTSDSGAIVQEQLVTAGNSTQANASSSGAIVQTMLGEMLADNSTQVNESTSGGVTQPQEVTAGNSTQINGSTSGAITMTHALSANNCLQINLGATGAVAQNKILTATNSIQINQCNSGRMMWTPGHWYNESDETSAWGIIPDDSTTWSPSPPITSNWS